MIIDKSMTKKFENDPSVYAIFPYTSTKPSKLSLKDWYDYGYTLGTLIYYFDDYIARYHMFSSKPVGEYRQYHSLNDYAFNVFKPTISFNLYVSTYQYGVNNSLRVVKPDEFEQLFKFLNRCYGILPKKNYKSNSTELNYAGAFLGWAYRGNTPLKPMNILYISDKFDQEYLKGSRLDFMSKDEQETHLG